MVEFVVDLSAEVGGGVAGGGGGTTDSSPLHALTSGDPSINGVYA